MEQRNLGWQSKAVLLIAMPFAAVDAALQALRWAAKAPSVAVSVLGISALLGLLTFILRAATPAAALTGAAITASLMFSTATFPFAPWRTALIPILAVFLLAFCSTRVGRLKKERLGTAEKSLGRMAPQVAANLGLAAGIASPFTRGWTVQRDWPHHPAVFAIPVFAVTLAALAEAAADTVSSEIGQVLGGRQS